MPSLIKIAFWILFFVTVTAAIGQPITTLTDGTPVTGLAGDKWTGQSFKVTVPPNQSRLTISTAGPPIGRDAGVVLYAKHGAGPTTTAYDRRSGLVGNNERISIENPASGDWYLLLYATTAFSGVTLLADFDNKPPAAPPTPLLALASVFSDHLVLQRNQPIPIWGDAKPGDTVTSDVGPLDPNDFHPPNKEPVGTRLALTEGLPANPFRTDKNTARETTK